MRWYHPFVIALAVLFGACSGSLSSENRSPSGLEASLRESEPFTAVVAEREAAFLIPLPERETWEWSSETTEDNAPEYRWEVVVSNGGEDYAFGFGKWKHPSLTPMRGSLSELIEAGQESLWRVRPEGGASVIKDGGIRVVPLGPARILLKVEGRANVRRLFSSRPSEATVRLESLGEPKVERAVTIAYME